MTTWVGVPAAAWPGLRPAFCASGRAFCSRRLGPAAASTRAPNMSERITEIAPSTKIQRIAR